MKKAINGVEVEMTPEEVAAWEAEQAAYVPSVQQGLTDEELLRRAMLEDFIERSAKNTTTPKALKEAALRLKDKK